MNNNVKPDKSQKNILPSAAAASPPDRRLIATLWIVGIILGALQAWSTRHHMNADGISYLDIADAYLRGDWKMAINAYWSPLYSWVLGLAMYIIKPSSYYEFTVVHFVNFMIYLCTLGCFHFFLIQLIHYHRSGPIKRSGETTISFPEWAWLALGYSLFFYTSLTHITIASVTPDMGVAAFVYLASGILLRIYRGATNYLTFALLGVVLGFSYLAKSVMFPLSFVYLSVSILSPGNFRKILPRAIIALIIFLSIASPFIIAISNAKGRFTFGDSGKYNYWVHVSRNENLYWNGEPAGSGTPKHPARKIFDTPAVYEFGSPIEGTYPLWYDTSYWYEGMNINLNLEKQLSAIKKNLKDLYLTVYPDHIVLFIVGLILYLMSQRRWLILKDIAKHWHILIPAIIAVGIYGLVHIDTRYIGPFIAPLWIGIFSGIRLPDSLESKKLLKYATIIMASVLMILTTRYLIKDINPRPHTQWQVAHALNQMGVSPGEKVASIGYSFGHFWARLARVHIVAEISSKDADDFWKSDSSVKYDVFKTFRRTGAKVIVTNIMPSDYSPVNWQKIVNTDYYIYRLS